MSASESERLLAGKNGERLRASIAQLGGWQPIETAPRDGTVLDLWCVWNDTNEGERISDCHWGEGTRAFEWEILTGWIAANEGVDGEAAILSEGFEPTHWMPLPEPPA
jgi:hypothetical protein